MDSSMSWTATPDAALKQLRAFQPRAGQNYSAERNYDYGPENRSNISCLSPWVRYQLISEECILRETLACHSLANAEKFAQEVFWRSYFKGWLEHHPSVWAQYRSDVNRLIRQLEDKPELQDGYLAASSGHTGIDAFDFWARELVTTGYLHNHARMWFASIWIFTLRLPWQLGADFFYRHLLDADPASNTLSWRWVAGLHTKGKTYLARASNIEKYTGGRFAPAGLAEVASPVAEDEIHSLKPIETRPGCDPSGPIGLLVTEENCTPEDLAGQVEDPRSILGIRTNTDRSPLETSALANAFASDALTGALTRAERRFGAPASLAVTEDWTTALVEWAEGNRIQTIVTQYLPVGPTRDRINQARPVLQNSGIRLLEIPRPYDVACWPNATKGFFKLKARIPDLIQTLGLARA